MSDHHDASTGDEPISKSEKKRQLNELQDLGMELAELPKEKLRAMNLDPDLLEAILDYKRFTAHGAKKRQEQYIGKLMRDVDPEPIRQYLAVLRGESGEHTAWLHLVERWRERLLESDETLAAFLNDFPEGDAQQLRTLIRNARKEHQEQKPPKAFRQLFQTIKALIPEPGVPAARGDGED
ncbi:ribosome biogenesis factor YjgA [Paludibacterium paludis]|uniref:Dual-action ribosomal maturation protein DarP n=1 Tax=Paludibacterium paludis TaxID=1225769 RepID=A0A918P462_9NEIS|nr:ribosome biogenesis factor YjgA [Paludibacterium paludis]GGY17389.1 UPF0307 protein [Paludibacterium paludis]